MINADMNVELECERTKELDKSMGMTREVERRIACVAGGDTFAAPLPGFRRADVVKLGDLAQ